jgi:RNA 3'-terminal phosphate cyclase (ATP)
MVDHGRVELDGSSGEGGGQILRTSLALSMITGQPLRMANIRAGRAKPGLRRQHLACVDAAARLCHAEVRGAQLSSQQLDFVPHAITGGELDIDIGSAGSASLVVQTILLPAIVAGHALRAVIHGGTHNPLAPPFEFLERVYLPHLRAMGARVEAALDRHGFANGGQGQGRGRDARDAHGQLTLTIGDGGPLQPLTLAAAGPVSRRRATVIMARLPTHVADREHAIVRERLGFAADECETRELGDGGPANVLLLEVERAPVAGTHGPIRELVSAFGEKGLRAETVAQRACDDMASWLAAEVPVGEHLADQLLLPLALAGGGRFRAAPLSLHSTTNIATIGHFLDVPITVTPDGATVIVEVGQRQR